MVAPAPASGGSAKRSLKRSELIARDLANYIVDQDLAEGTVLPNEKQLVEAFQAGRTTMREALRLLETRGVLTVRPGPGGGPVVRKPRPADLESSLSLILQFANASLTDVLEARHALEPMMARLAADRISEEQLDVLAESVDRMREHASDHDIFLMENQRFHGTVADATGSVVLRIFNETLKAIADGAVVGVKYSTRRRQAVASAHERVLEALRSGDGVAAEDAMREHLAEAGAYWKRRYSDLVSQGVRWV